MSAEAGTPYPGQHDDCIATMPHYHDRPYRAGDWGSNGVSFSAPSVIEAAKAVVLAAPTMTPEIAALNRALAAEVGTLDEAWAAADAALPEASTSHRRISPAFVSPRDAITYATELEATPSVSPKRPTATELAALPDADFATFIEDSGIGTVSRPLRSPGGRPTGSSDPPVRMGAEVDRPLGALRGSSAGLGGQSQ